MKFKKWENMLVGVLPSEINVVDASQYEISWSHILNLVYTFNQSCLD